MSKYRDQPDAVKALVRDTEVHKDLEQADRDAGRYTLRTAFHYVEPRLDRQDLYAGGTAHELSTYEGQLRIRLKRVDLVSCDAAFENINLIA